MKKIISIALSMLICISLLPCASANEEVNNIIKEIYVSDDILAYNQTILEGIPATYYYPSNYFTTFNISTTGFDKKYIRSVTMLRFVPSGNGQKAGNKMQIYNVTPEMKNISSDMSYSSISAAGGFSSSDMVYEELFTENEPTACYDEIDITEFMTDTALGDSLTLRTDFLKANGNSFIPHVALVYPNEQANMRQRTKIVIEYDLQAIIDDINNSSDRELEYLICKYGDLLGIDVKTYAAIENKSVINNLITGKSFTSVQEIKQAVEQSVLQAYPTTALKGVSDNADNASYSFAAAQSLKNNTYTVMLDNVNFNLKNIKSVRSKIYITNIYNNPQNYIYTLDEKGNVIGSGYFDGTKNKYHNIDITDYAKSQKGNLKLNFSGPSVALTFQTSLASNPPQIEISFDKNGIINDLNSAATPDEFEQIFGDYGIFIGFDPDYISRYKHKIAESFYLRRFDNIEALIQAVNDYANVLAQDVLDRMNNSQGLDKFKEIFETEYEMLGIDLDIYNTLSESDKTYYSSKIYKHYGSVDEFKETFSTLFSTAFSLNTTVSTPAEMEEYILANGEALGLDTRTYNQIKHKEKFNNILLEGIPYKNLEAFSSLFEAEIEKRISEEFTIIPVKESGYSDIDLTDFSKCGNKIYKFDLNSKYTNSDYLISAELLLTRSSGDSARNGDIIVYSADNSWTDSPENLSSILSDTSVTAGKISSCSVPAGKTKISIDIIEFLKQNTNQIISLRTAGNLQGYYNPSTSLSRNSDGAKILIKADIAGILEAVNNADKNTLTDIIINNGQWLGINTNAYINYYNKTDINEYLLTKNYKTANELKQRFDEFFNTVTYSVFLPSISDGGSSYNANLGSLSQDLTKFYYNKFDIDELKNDYILSVKVGYTKAQKNGECSNAYIYGGSVTDDIFSPNTGLLDNFVIGDELNTYYETDITDYAKSQSGVFTVGIQGDKFAYINRISNAPYIKITYDLLKIVNAIGLCSDQASAKAMLNTYSKELSLYSDKQIESLSAIIPGMKFDRFSDFASVLHLTEECRTGIVGVDDNKVIIANANSQEENDIVTVIALFDKDNLMTSVLSVNTIDSIPAGKTITVPYCLDSNESDVQLRVFLWKGSRALKPIETVVFDNHK